MTITCHGRDLSLVTAAIVDQRPGAQPLPIDTAAVTVSTSAETLTLPVSVDGAPLPAGQYVLSMTYHGRISEDMSGLYRSTYTGADGTPAYLYSTQFETTYARRVFPCWDEPAYKVQHERRVVARATAT